MFTKYVRKTIGLLLITTLFVGGSFQTASAETTTKDSGKIRSVTLANAGAGTTKSYKAKAFIYVPANVDVSNRPGTAPVLVVYGDKDFTAASALKTADSSGIGKIAAEEECIILFVNSIGEQWGEADKGSLSAVYTSYSISSNKVYPDGISSDGFFPGFPARTYVFAEGRGADFVAKYLVKGVDTQDYLTPAVIPFKPTGVILDNVKEPVITAGDEVAAYLINGTKEIYDTFKKLNVNCKKVGQQTSKIKNGFDKEAVLKGYEEVVSTAIKLERNIIVDVPKYDKLGITEKREYIQHFDTKIEYYSYIPNDRKDSAKGTVPLLFLFHGFDASAEQQAWLSEWPIIGKENGFMVVSVNRHTNYTAALMEELLNYLKKEYPMIDSTRVYASGYSMGAVKTWGLADEFGNEFAGIIPTNGAFNEVNPKYPNLIMPTFYIAGDSSQLPELPHQKFSIFGDDGLKANTVDTRIAGLFKLNMVTDHYSFDRNADAIWGIKANKSYSVQSRLYSHITTTVNLYNSEDGNCYTALACNSNSGHIVVAQSCRAAWDFIEHFSRNADGTLTIK